MASNDRLVSYPGFPKGIDNVSPEQSVKDTALRAAVNVDMDNDGKMRRRQGYGLAAVSDGLHSLFTDPRMSFMVAANDLGLVVFDDTLSQIVVAPLAGVGDPVSYAVGEYLTYFSTVRTIGALDNDTGAVRAVSAPQPSGQPTVSVNPLVGGLNAGVYQVAITFEDALKRESGSSLSVEVDVPEGGGLVLSDWPDTTGAAAVNIYMTSANGDVLYLADSIVPSGAFLLGRRTMGRPLDTQFLSPMPPGANLCIHAGRLFLSVGSTQVWSEALNYGLTNPAVNWTGFNTTISLQATAGLGASGGMYVASGTRTYFMTGGDPSSWQRVIAHPQGAVPNSLCYVRPSDIGLEQPGMVPVWMDDRGEMIAGTPTGQIIRLHKDTYIGPARAERGATVVFERDGIRQLINTTQGGSQNRFVASDSVEATICRNGVPVE